MSHRGGKPAGQYVMTYKPPTTHVFDMEENGERYQAQAQSPPRYSIRPEDEEKNRRQLNALAADRLYSQRRGHANVSAFARGEYAPIFLFRTEYDPNAGYNVVQELPLVIQHYAAPRGSNAYRLQSYDKEENPKDRDNPHVQIFNPRPVSYWSGNRIAIFEPARGTPYPGLHLYIIHDPPGADSHSMVLVASAEAQRSAVRRIEAAQASVDRKWGETEASAIIRAFGEDTYSRIIPHGSSKVQQLLFGFVSDTVREVERGMGMPLSFDKAAPTY